MSNPDIWATWLGKTIAKVNGGKFKSDEKTAVPQRIIPHPQHPRAIPAFVLEDGSVISCELCILDGTKPEWKDAPPTAVALYLDEATMTWVWSDKSDRTRRFNTVRPKEFMGLMDPEARKKVEAIEAQRIESMAVKQRNDALYSQIISLSQKLRRKLDCVNQSTFKGGARDERSRTERRNRLKSYHKLADLLLSRGKTKAEVLNSMIVFEHLSDGDFQATVDFYEEQGDEA